jgi:rhamnosyltransferase
VKAANNACAVVVTYHPSASIFAHLATLRAQAQGLVVVDNGSTSAVLTQLKSEGEATDFHLIENRENRGVATALNTGVRWAVENRYRWVALFDQDSTVPDGYLNAMFAGVESQSDMERIAIVAPQYRDPDTGVLYKSAYTAEDGSPLEVMTSGSLLPTWVFEMCGWFEESLFIDEVDHEFCFRVRERGYRVFFCENAILTHLFGSRRRHKLLGIKWVTLTNYSPERRYYMTRNGLVIACRYRRKYPLWSHTAVKYILWHSPVVILLAETQRWKKLAYVTRGIIDAVLGRMGKRVDL